MYLTSDEKTNLLQLIQQAQKISEQKTDAIEKILYSAKYVAQENEILMKENKMLKSQLEIAEREIMRLGHARIEPQS